MRYCIKEIRVVEKQKSKLKLTAKRRVRALCPYTAVSDYEYTQERIRLDDLFEIGEIEGVEPQKIKKRRVRQSFKSILATIRSGTERIRQALAIWSKEKTDDKKWLSFLSGALCGTLCVTVLSALAVLALLFGTYFLPYKEIRVPSLVGEDISKATEELDNGFELELTYQNDDQAAAGVILRQTPAAGTVRKYRSADQKHKISVTVSTGKRYYTVPELSGLSQRDAVLALRNEDVAITTVYEYSPSVPSGSVISTSPQAGTALFDGETLVLKISLGKEKILVGVPDLYTLTEAQAKELLASKGLSLGSVTYQASSKSAGTIISQQYSPYSKIERGSTVDVTISLGNGYAQRTAPDLYGLTVDGARARLSEYGLVLGGIYSVLSGAQKGTVVAQSPIAGTPLTPEINSIDIFISS